MHFLINKQPYNVRNSLFGLIEIVVSNEFKGENLSEEQRTCRDEFLEDLYNHMMDVNSYVRSKVLHIWNELKAKDAVPLAWILRIVTRAIERLEDKSSSVRKNAITLLKSFLESNPFSSKVNSSDWVCDKMNIYVQN